VAARIGRVLSAGIVSEIAAYTVLQHQGFAGNSVASMGVAALCLVTFVTARKTPAQIAALFGLVAGAVLLATANLHGVGFTVGAIAGTIACAFRLGVPIPQGASADADERVS
jgi:hypothetical protein